MKVKSRRKELQAQELLVASMQGEAELINQMKTIKMGTNAGNNELPHSVGDVEGEQNIAEMFKASYEKLYNSAPSHDEMFSMKNLLNDMISLASKDEVEMVSASVVKEAVLKLKAKKTDVSGSLYQMH